MTDPYRYLPCTLHEALEIPWDVPWCRWRPDGPKEQIGPQSFVQVVVSDIDLAHPAGWDHAVRALAAIRGVEVPESCSVAFVLREPNGYGVPVAEVYVMDAMGTSGRLVQTFAEPPHCPHRDLSVVLRRGCTPVARREALCRCICAALGVDVGAVFS